MGAGTVGLAAAERLSRAGCSVREVDARGRVGARLPLRIFGAGRMDVVQTPAPETARTSALGRRGPAPWKDTDDSRHLR
ncbi:NAD(P)-binding protein [Nocardia sp. NPDC050193]